VSSRKADANQSDDLRGIARVRGSEKQIAESLIVAYFRTYGVSHCGEKQIAESLIVAYFCTYGVSHCGGSPQRHVFAVRSDDLLEALWIMVSLQILWEFATVRFSSNA
jgi:hypothetical protein